MKNTYQISGCSSNHPPPRAGPDTDVKQFGLFGGVFKRGEEGGGDEKEGGRMERNRIVVGWRRKSINIALLFSGWIVFGEMSGDH